MNMSRLAGPLHTETAVLIVLSVGIESDVRGEETSSRVKVVAIIHESSRPPCADPMHDGRRIVTDGEERYSYWVLVTRSWVVGGSCERVGQEGTNGGTCSAVTERKKDRHRRGCVRRDKLALISECSFPVAVCGNKSRGKVGSNSGSPSGRRGSVFLLFRITVHAVIVGVTDVGGGGGGGGGEPFWEFAHESRFQLPRVGGREMLMRNGSLVGRIVKVDAKAEGSVRGSRL
jgi:hypothetical protein